MKIYILAERDNDGFRVVQGGGVYIIAVYLRREDAEECKTVRKCEFDVIRSFELEGG